VRQTGAGIGGDHMTNFYRGGIYQRGHGLGSILSSVFRAVLPLMKSGAKYVGREALTTGLNIIDDHETTGDSYKKVVKRQMADAGQRVLKKMRGGGGKSRKSLKTNKNARNTGRGGGGGIGSSKKNNRPRKKNNAQSQSRRVTKKKKKETLKCRDIFS